MRRIPDWIKVKLPKTSTYAKVRSAKGCLHTICEEARCPNRGECWDAGTATFLILGDTCTRDCRYCNVKHGTPQDVDADEPVKLAESIKELGLKYAVITSVTRDDLDDGGADQFVRCINEIRKLCPHCRIEVLIPDFGFNKNALTKVVKAKPFVLNHNIEVVRSLFPEIRPQGDYDKSLDLLRSAKEPGQITKSGFMIGFGEDINDIKATLNDLREAKVDNVTIGQYLQPNKTRVPVKKYYTPDEFEEIGNYAESLGFNHVESAPLVRSSYHAAKSINQ